jgi:hypothetical protein
VLVGFGVLSVFLFDSAAVLFIWAVLSGDCLKNAR